MLARLACLNPNDKAIDDELKATYETILGRINKVIYEHENKFRAAQIRFKNAKTKEETMQALEDMTTHATVCDKLEEDRQAINSKFNAIMHKYDPKEDEDEEADAYDGNFYE